MKAKSRRIGKISRASDVWKSLRSDQMILFGIEIK